MTARPLHVAMDDLVDAMTTPEELGGAYLDLGNGTVAYTMPAELGDDDETAQAIAPDRFAKVPQIASREQYAWMRAFADRVDEADLREKLDLALRGKGAFGRFRDVVFQYPDLRESWEKTQQEALVAEAVRWLRDVVRVEPTYELRRRQDASPAAPVAPRSAGAAPSIGLVDVLLLGAPDGKTELVNGRVLRRLRATSPDAARGLFKSLAREICESHGIGWRKRFIEGKDTFEQERMHLTLRGVDVELAIDVPKAIWKAFG